MGNGDLYDRAGDTNTQLHTGLGAQLNDLFDTEWGELGASMQAFGVLLSRLLTVSAVGGVAAGGSEYCSNENTR